MSRKARKSQAQAKSTQAQASKEQTMTTQTQAKAAQQHAYVVQLVKMGKPTATIWQANDIEAAQHAMWGLKADRHNVGTFHAVDNLTTALVLCQGYEIIEAEMPQAQTEAEIKAEVTTLLDEFIEEVTIEVQAQTIEEPTMNTMPMPAKVYASECYNEGLIHCYQAVEAAMAAEFQGIAPECVIKRTFEGQDLDKDTVSSADYSEELEIIQQAARRIAEKIKSAKPIAGVVVTDTPAQPEPKAAKKDEPKAEPKATKKAKAAKKAEPKPEVKSEPKAEPTKDATKAAFKKRHELRAAAKAAVLAHPELRNLLSRGLNSKNEELVAVLTSAKAMTTKATKPAEVKAEVKVQACNIAYRDLQAMLKEARIAGKDVQVKLNAKANELMAEAQRLGLTK